MSENTELDKWDLDVVKGKTFYLSLNIFEILEKLPTRSLKIIKKFIERILNDDKN